MASAAWNQKVRNRRLAHRVQQNLPVEFYGDDLKPITARTLNLSPTGARIITPNSSAGEFVHVFIDLGGPLGGRQVRALADTVWENSNEVTGFTVIGLHFTGIAAGDRQTLEHFCGYHASTSKNQTNHRGSNPCRARAS